MAKLEKIFPERELVQFLRAFEIPEVDQTDLTLVTEYSDETYNPFDINFRGIIYFNNRLMISFSKADEGISVRVGKDGGWIGGLEISNTILAFTIKELTLNEFKQGFTKFWNEPKYCLVSEYQSGTNRKVHRQGSLNELILYAEGTGYETVHREKGRFPYFIKVHLPPYEDRILSIKVLTDQQIKNINSGK